MDWFKKRNHNEIKGIFKYAIYIIMHYIINLNKTGIWIYILCE